MRFWILVALAGIAGQGNATAVDCVTAQSWYDVCDYNNRICIISSAICEPYGSLFDVLVNGPSIQPTEETPWEFLIDPVYRLKEISPTHDGTTLNIFYCKDPPSSQSASNCLNNIQNDFANQDIADYVTIVQQHALAVFSEADLDQLHIDRANNIVQSADTFNTALRDALSQTSTAFNPEDEGIKIWDFSAAFVNPNYNYVTVRSLGNNKDYFPAVFIKLSRDVSANDDGFPKCRVFDIPTHHFTLQGITIFTGDCFTFYRAPGQVFGDDGTAIAFSGDSARGSKVIYVYVETLYNFTRDITVDDNTVPDFGEIEIEEQPMYTQSGVALRVGNQEYGTIDASAMEIIMTTANANASVVLYDYKAVQAPTVTITAGINGVNRSMS